MLGSVQDAEDALQETLLAAWRGLAGFQGRSSLRSWLYRIATHACLRLAATRRRVLSPEYGPARTDVHQLGDLRANAHLAFACYQGRASGALTEFRLSAINVVSIRAGRVATLTGFLDPNVHRCFGLAAMRLAPPVSHYFRKGHDNRRS